MEIRLLSSVFGPLLLPVVSMHAVVIFDNGFTNNPGGNFIVNTNLAQRVFDNFSLSQKATITDVVWQQYDNSTLTPADVALAFYDAIPETAPALFNETRSTIRAIDPMVGSVTFGGDSFHGYEHRISGLSLMLNPGNYWIGMNSLTPDRVSIVSGLPPPTSPSSDRIPGRWVIRDDPSFSESSDSDVSFRLEGTLVPDNGPTVWMLVLAIVGVAILRQRLGVA